MSRPFTAWDVWRETHTQKNFLYPNSVCNLFLFKDLPEEGVLFKVGEGAINHEFLYENYISRIYKYKNEIGIGTQHTLTFTIIEYNDYIFADDNAVWLFHALFDQVRTARWMELGTDSGLDIYFVYNQSSIHYIHNIPFYAINSLTHLSHSEILIYSLLNFEAEKNYLCIMHA